jgi:hypothetical protein
MDCAIHEPQACGDRQVADVRLKVGTAVLRGEASDITPALHQRQG